MRASIFLITLLFSWAQLKAAIIETRHVEDVLPFIDEETWFLVDLDNCMFEAVQALGHANWFYGQIQQKMRLGMTQEDAIREAYPDWIKTQNICQVKPVEENFVRILSSLQDKGIIIMGCTHRQPSVVDATFRQVRSLGFDFSKSSPYSQNEVIIPSQTPVLYSQGILFVGDYNKKIDIFKSFLSLIGQKPKKVVFIDDKLKNVVELEELSKLGIEYQGIHYTAIEHTKPVYVSEIAEFQQKFLSQILSNESALLLMQNKELMNAIFNTSSFSSSSSEAMDIIDTYFERLAIAENWDEIMSQGLRALQAARASGRMNDEARICAQLTSTSFYQGEYAKALEYANRCHELSEKFEDPSLFLRALYLESAVHRALADKQADEIAQQMSYFHAIKIAEEAAKFYEIKALDNPHLRGKIYFNWGAAHADNPKGDLSQARACYLSALHNFESINATDDVIRTMVRLGKVHLLLKEYSATEDIIREVRSNILGARIAMQVDYLEAQLKCSIGDYSGAVQIAKTGLERAEKLGAKEDQYRLGQLLQKALSKKGA